MRLQREMDGVKTVIEVENQKGLRSDGKEGKYGFSHGGFNLTAYGGCCSPGGVSVHATTCGTSEAKKRW